MEILTLIEKRGYVIDKSFLNLKDINNIKDTLTVTPFNYFNKKNNFYNNSIKFEVYTELETSIIVPKYYGLKKFGIPSTYMEYTGNIIDITFTGNLRDNQINIINKTIEHIDKYSGGVLCLPCGSGKTVLSIFLICHYKVKTLIIVHKTFLLNQWKERIMQFTNASIGIIQQNKVNVEGKDVVIAMLQSISKNKYDKEIFKDFGMVIFDEAHHAPSQHFSKALPIISSKISLGLTATLERADKLEKVLHWYFGDIIYKEESFKNSDIQINTVFFNVENHSKFKEIKMFNGEINRQLMLNKIITIGRRNIIITNIILNTIKENDKRKIIVLSDRVKHLELLKTRLDNYNITSTSYYIGGMNTNELKRSEEATVIFATYGMAAEGLDIPKLNTLIMATSRRNVEQSIGRVTREKSNIMPIIYDIVDKLPVYISQFNFRKRYYIKNGYTVSQINH